MDPYRSTLSKRDIQSEQVRRLNQVQDAQTSTHLKQFSCYELDQNQGLAVPD